MKMLYASNRDETLTLKDVSNLYNNSVNNTYNLYLFCTYALTKICRVASEDEENRKKKYIPTEVDKIFTSKLYENEIVQYLDHSTFLTKKAEELKFSDKATADFAKKIYSNFSKEQVYIDYFTNDDSPELHLEMLLELFRFCRKNEYYTDIMEDQYIDWIDNKSLAIGAVKKTLKSLPCDHNIFEDHTPDPEIVDEFGLVLLTKTFEEDDELLQLIKPVLENWDSERLAIIDLIIIKMALIEFTNFNTIPVKVTLNEYVGIAKTYSTPKSKEFVNGILDKLLKKMTADNLIVKEGRGLID
jgi:N utilization substance protein B